MRAEQWWEGPPAGAACSKEQIQWWIGLALLFVTAAPWAVSLCYATSCQLCSSTRKELLPYLSLLLGGVVWAQLWK